MRLPVSIASMADILLAIGLLSAVIPSSMAASSPGSISVFSDDSCAATVVSYNGSVRLDSCIPASTTGNLSTTFIVGEKPVCQDNKRPDLVLFEDACCGGGVTAHFIPDASYGDYGNGSCQHLIGGGFRALVFVCGSFHVPTSSSIVASSTSPASGSKTSVSIPAVCLATVASTTTTAATGDATTSPSRTTTGSASDPSRTNGSDPGRAGPLSIVIVMISFAILLQ